MPILRYLGTRLALAALTLFAISLVTFFATNVIPSNPARTALGKAATAEQVAAYAEEQGLNRPILERYGHWVGDLVQGDWGTSVFARRAVSEQVQPRIVRSVILAGVAMGVAVAVAFAVGVYTGQRRGRPVDVAVSLAALFVNSLPEFVVGIVLIVVFAVQAGVLPIESSAASLGSGLDQVEAYVLPALALAIVLTPYMARMVRVNVSDVLDRPYVRAAVLRGFSRRRVIWQHVVPNASLPVVNVVALSLAELVGGVVVTETVFGFPGIGNLLVDSVISKDLPTVQAIAIVMGVGFVVLNFAADAIVLALNPRLRTR
jgi:peptide/nickel transport system permease protein